jgi:glycerol uptake facilitator-like aquaporin
VSRAQQPLPLPRRALAEALGTGLLVTIVVGSGIMAQRLCGGNVGLELLANSTATALGLSVLILVLAPVSGAHFNPVVTIAARLLARADADADAAKETAVYVAAQIAGGIAGALLANAMFGLSTAEISDHARSGTPLWLGEVVATAGLVLLVFGLTRSGQAKAAPAAVGAYIGAAYWFTSSTSFANPAVTIAREFTNTFAGIAPSSVAGFILAQSLGAAIGTALVAALFPRAAPAAASAPAPEAPAPLANALDPAQSP